ncbi:hypothetical protein [Acinetobacter baumannii]
MSNEKLKRFVEGDAARVIVRLDPLERDVGAALDQSKREAMRIAVHDGFISPECLNCHCFKVQSEVVHSTHMDWKDELRTTIRCDSKVIFRPTICPAPVGSNYVPNKINGGIVDDESYLYGKWGQAAVNPSTIKADASALNALTSRVTTTGQAIHSQVQKIVESDAFSKILNDQILAENWGRTTSSVEPRKKTAEELQKELEEGSDELAGITKDMPRSGGVAW